MATKGTVYYATGRRKTSAARVFLKTGSGKVIVNNHPIEKYLPTKTSIMKALSPFDITATKGQYDAEITVAGSGKIGPAGAICHGITHALLAVETPESFARY